MAKFRAKMYDEYYMQFWNQPYVPSLKSNMEFDTEENKVRIAWKPDFKHMVAVDWGALKGSKSKLMIFDEYKGEKKMDKCAEEPRRRTELDGNGDFSYADKPIVDMLADYAYRAGAAEAVNRVTQDRLYETQSNLNRTQDQLVNYKDATERLERENKALYSRTVEASNKLYAIRERLRRAAAKKREAAKPKTAKKK